MTRTCEIYVVACRARPAIVLAHLGGVTHHVHWTTDYDLPEGWKVNPRYGSWVNNHTGHLRCFRGHQDALKLSTADCALILEDDAIPNAEEWLHIVNAAVPYLDRYEVISLHGRAWHPDAFTHGDLSGPKVRLSEPKVQKSGSVWVQGSLAYLIRKDAKQRLIEREYDGFPIDIFLCNHFNFALVNPSPFDHGSQVCVKSLID